MTRINILKNILLLCSLMLVVSIKAQEVATNRFCNLFPHLERLNSSHYIGFWDENNPKNLKAKFESYGLENVMIYENQFFNSSQNIIITYSLKEAWFIVFINKNDGSIMQTVLPLKKQRVFKLFWAKEKGTENQVMVVLTRNKSILKSKVFQYINKPVNYIGTIISNQYVLLENENLDMSWTQQSFMKKFEELQNRKINSFRLINTKALLNYSYKDTFLKSCETLFTDINKNIVNHCNDNSYKLINSFNSLSTLNYYVPFLVDNNSKLELWLAYVLDGYLYYIHFSTINLTNSKIPLNGVSIVDYKDFGRANNSVELTLLVKNKKEVYSLFVECGDIDLQDRFFRE